MILFFGLRYTYAYVGHACMHCGLLVVDGAARALVKVDSSKFVTGFWTHLGANLFPVLSLHSVAPLRPLRWSS